MPRIQDTYSYTTKEAIKTRLYYWGMKAIDFREVKPGDLFLYSKGGLEYGLCANTDRIKGPRLILQQI